MTREDYCIAATEALQLLPYFGQEEIDKIPEKFMDFLNSYHDDRYIRYFDINKPFAEIDMSRSTKVLFGLIYRNYWCDEEGRQSYDAILKENEERYQKALSEKYSSDVFGKKNTTVETSNDNPEAVVTQDTTQESVAEDAEDIFSPNGEIDRELARVSFFTKIKNKILSFFKKENQ